MWHWRAQRLLFRLERKHGHQWTEYFLADKRHVVCAVGKNGRCDVKSLGKISVFQHIAATHVSRSARFGCLHVAADLVEMFTGNERTELGSGIEWITDADGFRALAEPDNKLIVNFVLHEYASPVRADLAG